MSGKAGSIGSIVLGAVLITAGVIGLAAGGSGTLLIINGILLVAAGSISLAMPPKATNRDTVRAQDLQIATAAEGIPIPVIFGEQRIVGNFENYEKSQFRSVKVTGRSDGSKGGDSTPANIIGFDYHLYYEYGLCMGTVDEIVQAFSSPGETKMMGATPTAVSFGTDDFKEISLDSLDPSASAGAESGIVRIYRGSPDQIRSIASDPYNYNAAKTTGPIKAGYTYKIGGHVGVNFVSFGAANNNVGTVFVATNTSGNVLTASDWVYEYTGLNYRNVCWVLFLDFKIGRFPTPKSYHFVLRRFPRHDTSFDVTRPDGTTITGFRSRGSADNTKPAYNEANPAAIIYECLTDTIWGRGLSPLIFDESSFATVSQYFQARHIGMSLTLDTPDKVFQIVDSIRQHLKTILVWDGEFLKLKCLLDLAETHSHIQALSKADLKNFMIVRPLWQSTFNEARVEFTNKARNFRPDTVHAMDLGNYQITGRLNSMRINLQGFTDFNTARRQAFRILREKSYPVMPLQWEMNRFHSQIEVGDVCKIFWDEVDQSTTVYALVVKIEDSDSETDDIKIWAVEDQTLIPATGQQATPSIPSQSAWERIPDIAQGDLQLWTGTVPSVSATKPAMVIEMPAILARIMFGTTVRGVLVLSAQQPAPFYDLFTLQFKRASDSNYSTSNYFFVRWAIAGTLLSDITNFDPWDRSSTGFTFQITDPDQDEATLLSLFSICDSATDDLADVVNNTGPYMFCGDEWFQIGKVEKIGTNQYRARNFVRGRHGSQIQIRLTGAKVMFAADLANWFPASTASPSVPFGSVIDFKARATFHSTAPVDLEGGSTFRITHTDPLMDTRYERLSDSPLAPEFWDVAAGPTIASVATNVIRVRPKWRNIGGGTKDFYNAILDLTTVLGTLTYRITLYDLTAGVNRTFVPGQQTILNQPASVLTVTLDPGRNPDEDSGLVTIGPIPIQFRANDQLNVGYATDQIRITAFETTAAFGALESVEDLMVSMIG